MLMVIIPKSMVFYPSSLVVDKHAADARIKSWSLKFRLLENNDKFWVAEYMLAVVKYLLHNTELYLNYRHIRKILRYKSQCL